MRFPGSQLEFFTTETQSHRAQRGDGQIDALDDFQNSIFNDVLGELSWYVLAAIALLHLDCDLYESYRTCLAALYPRVAPGGVILFDEYEDSNFPGAKRAIDEFFTDKPEQLLIYDDLHYLKYYVVKT